MNTLAWINAFLNLLALLSVVVGLWISGRLLPAVFGWLRSRLDGPILTNPFAKILLWLALGSLFTFPLLDLVRWLGLLANVVFLADTGSVSTMSGIISPQVFSIFPILLTVIVYGVTVYFGSDFLSRPSQLPPVERIFILLSLASLVYNGILSIFTAVFSFQFPLMNVQQNYGVSGYLFEILVGLAILSLILLGVNRGLPNHPMNRK